MTPLLASWVVPYVIEPLVVAALWTLAVLGGGRVVGRVFRRVDRAPGQVGVIAAGEVLRGGAWIGALERLVIFGTLLAGYPEGIAVVLVVKGLARYPELRAGDSPGAAERFIIGTLVSAAAAMACAWLADSILRAI